MACRDDANRPVDVKFVDATGPAADHGLFKQDDYAFFVSLAWNRELTGLVTQKVTRTYIITTSGNPTEGETWVSCAEAVANAYAHLNARLH